MQNEIMAAKIILLEDEPRVQRFIQSGLEQTGMSVDCVNSIDDFESALLTHQYDVAILDRLIGIDDSIHHLPILKRKWPQMKVLVLSALSEVSERVHGLDTGADDYLGKPFHIDELISRIRALGRRDAKATSVKIHIADLVIDLETHKATRTSGAIDLTSKEWKLLLALASKPGKVFSRSELLQRAWNMNFDPGSNVVDVNISRLKKKINMAGLPPLVHSKRGGGYYISAEENSE